MSLPLLPEASYLDLPKSSCDAIAVWLPVTCDAGLGLYTWNTENPRYMQVASSPTVDSFVFRTDDITEQSTNMSFMLLNLTRESPLATSHVPYSFCNAQADGRYSLGRAFLQAMFAGANWNFNNIQRVWWLAQVPGPNFGTGITVLPIADHDGSIFPYSNDWADTRKGVLVPLMACQIAQIQSSHHHQILLKKH